MSGALSFRGTVFVLTGPAGAGKTSVLRALRSRLDGVHFCVTATTRRPRPGERHAVDYYFYSDADFLRLVAENGFLEYAHVPPPDGPLYGSPRAQIEEAFTRGEDVFLQVDVQGARSVRTQVPDAVTMFLRSPDAETLRRRLRGRGTEGAGEIERRMRNAEVELSHEPEFDYSVVNGDGALDEAVVEVVNIIERERITRRGMRPGGG